MFVRDGEIETLLNYQWETTDVKLSSSLEKIMNFFKKLNIKIHYKKIIPFPGHNSKRKKSMHVSMF